MYFMESLNIRKARPGDEIALMSLIQELAIYEKEPEAVINTAEQLAIDLFKDKICDSFVLTLNDEVIGMALYYISYSTWRGRSLYLEDFYIQPKYRRTGYGKLLFDALLDEASRLKVKRMDWQVLEWNEPAIKFYQKIGAELDPEWLNGRLYFD